MRSGIGALLGSSTVGHCRDILRLGTSRHTLRLGTARICCGKAQAAYSDTLQLFQGCCVVWRGGGGRGGYGWTLLGYSDSLGRGVEVVAGVYQHIYGLVDVAYLCVHVEHNYNHIR